METFDDTKSQYIANYRTKLQGLLENLDPSHRPSPDRIGEIVQNSADHLNVDGLLLHQYLGQSNFAQTQFGFPGLPNPPNPFPGLPNPLQPLPLPSPGKSACIAGNMAVGAAICAAWVASGGTLAIGEVVAGGVTITSQIYAALVGGASGAIIAGILCQ
jgi:hypothetical protein